MKALRAVLTVALFAIAATLVVGVPARADRVLNYFGENPRNDDANQMWRFQRNAMGTFLMNALGLTNVGQGFYAGLTVNTNSGLNVEVDTASNQQGMLYQVAQSDPSPVPNTGSLQIGSDNTLVVVPFQQTKGTSVVLGPLTPPGTGGWSKVYLIEAQGSTADTNSQSRMFVNSQGQIYNQTQPIYRSDQISYQSVAGSGGVSPTPPPTDAGWVAIATVTVPFGASSVTSGMISMAAPFAGFISSGSGGNTYNGNNTIVPACTATAGGDCASSGAWQVQSSNWNGSSGVTHTWGMSSDSADFLKFKYGNNPEFSVDSTGNVTAYGNIAANASPLTLCGAFACAHPATLTTAGLFTVTHLTTSDLSGTKNLLCDDSSGNVNECGNGNWPFSTGASSITVVVKGTCAAGTICLCKASGASGGESNCDSDFYYNLSPHTGCHPIAGANTVGAGTFGLMWGVTNVSTGANTGDTLLPFNATGSSISDGTDIAVYITCIGN